MTLGGLEKMCPTLQSLTHPFPGTFRPSFLTVSKKKVELGSEGKGGSQGVGDTVSPVAERRCCAPGLLPTAVAVVFTVLFSAKTAEVVAVTEWSSAWAVKSAGRAEQTLLHSA